MDIVYTNIQSFVSHRDELIINIVNCLPHIILLSETRITEDFMDFECSLDNYNLIRCNSENRHTGGVLMYIRKGIVYQNIQYFILPGNYWSVIADIKLYNNFITLGVIYHSPNASHSVFLNNLEELC